VKTNENSPTRGRHIPELAET